MDAAFVLAGAVMLYFGAEWLVGGASRLALSLRVPQLVVGLTVVAYGTSMPEIVVSVRAALGDHGDVALGNVIGSNIANLGLILGLATLVRPARVDGALRRRELPVLLVATLALPLVLYDGVIRPWEAAGLVALAISYTAWMVRASRKQPAVTREAVLEALETAEAAEEASTKPPPSPLGQAGLALVGLLVLLVGGELFLRGATALAAAWGMSERLVGLTIVAVGTSLPELATSVVAALRGSSDIAVGNVIGSNILNVLMCLGGSGVVGTLATTSAFGADLGVLVAMTVVGLVFLRTERVMRRWEGFVLLAGYLVYLTWTTGR